MIEFKWIDRGREPREPANPDFPEGIDVDLSHGQKSCHTTLPYPSKRCGYYAVVCKKCKFSAIITTAGRADDPRSVRLPCKT